MSMRYLKITLVDGTRFILRVTRESPLVVRGVEVNAEGDEVVPPGFHQRLRIVGRDSIAKSVEMRMNPKYATLEVVPRGELAKNSSQLDAKIAEALKHGGHAAIARRTAAQDHAHALQVARRQGYVYAGWNPGGGGRVSANVLRALERSGLLSVSKTSAGELVGTLTRARAAAGEVP